MNTHSAQNYFRTTSPVGVGYDLGGRRVFSLAINNIFIRKFLKIVLWIMPLVLGINIWCATQVSTHNEKIAAVQETLVIATAVNEELTQEHGLLYAPDAIKLAAGQRLLLFKAGPGQIKNM